MKRIFVVLAFVMPGVVACGTTRFGQLSGPEQDQFNDCFRENRWTLCPIGGKAIEHEYCRKRLEDDYAKQPDAEARARWLGAHCSERHGALDGDSRLGSPDERRALMVSVAPLGEAARRPQDGAGR